MDNFDISKISTYDAGIAQSAMHRLLQKISDEILQPFGITKMQWMIIGATLDAGKNGIRISDLSRKLGTTLPYVTTSVHLLESRNILKKQGNGQDSRSKLISVEPSFLPKCKEIEKVLRAGLRESIYKHVKPEEFSIYLKVLYELTELSKDFTK